MIRNLKARIIWLYRIEREFALKRHFRTVLSRTTGKNGIPNRLLILEEMAHLHERYEQLRFWFMPCLRFEKCS